MSLGLVVVVLAYLSRGCWGGAGTSLPKENSALGSPRDQEDLIHMDGLIVPVSRPRYVSNLIAFNITSRTSGRSAPIFSTFLCFLTKREQIHIMTSCSYLYL